MGIEFNPNIRGKHIYKTEDAATLERVDAPMFNFRAPKTELVPELKPRYVERIENSATKGMELILRTMPDKVEERKEREELKQSLADIYAIDERYVNDSTAANAAMNPYLT